MKKVSPKTVSKIKKVPSEIEILTNLVVNGFTRMEDRFEQIDARFEQIDARFEQIDARFEQIDARFEQIDARFTLNDTQFFSIHHELKDHRERLERIERNQSTMLVNLDESIHRSEFKSLITRVDILEKKVNKK
jgi:chromosome segregation ATPase